MDLPWRLFAGILVIWLLVGVVPFVFWGNLHAAAEFASAFGFVNALFAALAFGGVIWAIRLQTKELELQRLEIEETRDELRRSADAQHQSQQMHFLSALLAAKNSVTQGYAAAAERESGPLRPNQMAHHNHLAELEWLLQQVDRSESNPFRLPPPAVLVAQQVELLLDRAHPLLRSAIANRAPNHARSLLLDVNQCLRGLRRLLPTNQAQDCELCRILDLCIAQAEGVATTGEFDDIVKAYDQIFNGLSGHVSAALKMAAPNNHVFR
jgi:hypothetical protein